MMLLPEQESIRNLLKTGEYTISSPDENCKAEIDKLLVPLKENVKRRVLKIDENLETQDMQDQQFDIIVLYDIVNNVQYPEVAIINVKKLLKPGGVICFVEVINPGSRLSMLGCSKSRYVKHNIPREMELTVSQTDRESSRICYTVMVLRQVSNLETSKSLNFSRSV
jgi:ubiquinone/menaquinone biosynthesis C-methylase UbiE